MSFHITTIQIAGLTLDSGYDDKTKEYYIFLSELAAAIDVESSVLSRHFRSSESLQAFAGKRLETTNRRVGKTQKKAISARDFGIFISWIAFEYRNAKAQALLTATFVETLERRIDSTLSIERTEASYEHSTKAFYRDLARVSFIPEFTFWLKLDSDEQRAAPVNYGAAVNQLKRVAHLPLVSVDEYDEEQIRTWSKVLTVYNAHRVNGSYHKGAISLVKRQFDVA